MAAARMGAANGGSDVVVRRSTGEFETNPDGFQTPEWADVTSVVPFRLGGANRGGAGTRPATIGTTEVSLAVRVGSFPHDVDAGDGLQDGDYIDIVAGENEGLVLLVVEGDWQDQATARRVPVVTVQRPEEWA